MPRVVVPAEAVGEARLAAGIEALPAADVAEAAELLRAPRARRPRPRPLPRATRSRRSDGDAAAAPPPATDEPAVDLVDVRGQAVARRALEIALAGGHALLLLGPPGAGKTLLARTIPGLLPDLDDEAALAATVVASVAATRPVEALVRRPPVRTPHHTTCVCRDGRRRARGCRPAR